MEELVEKTKIKICGITRKEEAAFLNEAKADYAGFVFFEKSKRNISLDKAQQICKSLNHGIQKVAVTVSPDVEQVVSVKQAGFDILQVHGTLSEEVVKASELPIWRAVNIADEAQLAQMFASEPKASKEKIVGYVVDGAGYGGGKPFDWERTAEQIKKYTKGKKLILAGGLNADNVRNGIRYFSPDVVDVSSSVEDEHGKSKAKIEEFVRKVREDE